MVIVCILGLQDPLVTPGNAVASFIVNPDKPTTNRLDMLVTLSKQASSSGSSIVWQKSFPKPGILGKEYQMINSGDVYVAFSEVDADNYLTRYNRTMKNFRDSSNALTIMPPNSSVPFITTVLLANIPQLVLSAWYFAYNAILTRLQLGQEWALFSTSFQPLRVSQLSILLILLSAMLHFLLSESSFVVLYTDDDWTSGLDSFKDYRTLPSDFFVAWGLSPKYLIGLLVLAIAAIQIPWLLGLLRLPGYMPAVGSDSRAMAAACHVSPLARAPLAEQTRAKGDGYEPVSMADEESRSGLLAVSRSLLSWGVVQMPVAWYDAQAHVSNRSEGRRAVEHVSFGTLLDGVKKPVDGHLYV
ncbi:hypothetical protein ACEQ8H_007525 [Pleosporales sp. CAS-2024a]